MIEFFDAQFRFYNFARAKPGDSSKQINEYLLRFVGDIAPCRRAIQRWMQPSVERRDSLEDEPRFGRIPEVVNEENAAAVRSLLIADARLTVEELSCATGLSETSVWRIVRDKLGYHKVFARWVPHLLTTDQKQHRVTLSKALLDMFGPGGSRRLTDIVTGDESWSGFWQPATKVQNKVWLANDEERPQVCKKSFASRKRMLTIYFNYRGPLVVDVLPEGATVTATSYGHVVIPKPVRAIEEQ